jgi:hypothetical protein
MKCPYLYYPNQPILEFEYKFYLYKILLILYPLSKSLIIKIKIRTPNQLDDLYD